MDQRPASIDFEEPADGWAAGQTTSFVAGRWSRETESGRVELSLLKMNPSEESWRLNVKAWAAQTGYPGDPDVDQLTSTVSVAGSSGRTLRLDSASDSDEPQSVVVAMFEDEAGNGWVLKLAGAPDSVDQFRTDFEKFLDSVTFR